MGFAHKSELPIFSVKDHIMNEEGDKGHLIIEYLSVLICENSCATLQWFPNNIRYEYSGTECRDSVMEKATGGRKYGIYRCHFQKEKYQEI